MNAEALLDLWFGPDLDSQPAVGERMGIWFGGGEAFDDLLRERFEGWPDAALAGELDAWRASPRGTLALILVLDQLPRNFFRGSARAFHYDAAALATARAALDRGDLDRLHPIEAIFLLLPLEHAEDLACQNDCIAGFEGLCAAAPADLAPFLTSSIDFARRHHVLIERFGRFPHRNAVLGRASTDEERTFLAAGGDTFA